MLRTCSIRLVSCRPPFTLTNLGASASSRISSAATALPSHAHAHARSPVLGCALGRAFGRASMSTSTSPGQVQVDVRPNPQGITPPAFYLPQGQGQGEAKARAHPPHWNSDQPTKSGFTSPWPSAASHGFLNFLRGRLFEWDEVPLPAREPNPEDGTPGLPRVHKPPSWGAGMGLKKDDIKLTWLGHAGCHLQIPLPTSQPGGTSTLSILTDPVLSRRCSPFSFAGPERYTDAPTSVKEMAETPEEEGEGVRVWPDVVVLSHNHYDHMDYATLKALVSRPNGREVPHFFCPLGCKKWLTGQLGLPEEDVTEMDWWDDRVITLSSPAHASPRRFRIVCTPAQHFSGRGLMDRDKSLWASWAIEALSPSSSSSSQAEGSTSAETEASRPLAKVWFGGDTGYKSVPRGCDRQGEEKLPVCPAFSEIGSLLGPFSLSLIPIGAYLPRAVMSSIHAAPHDSVRIHTEVRSLQSVGIHWGAFRLTPEDVNEPPKLLKEEMGKAGLENERFQTLEIGQTEAYPVQPVQ